MLVVLVLLTALLPCLQISSFFAGIIVDVIVLVTSKSEKKEQEEVEGKKETNEQKQKKEKEKKEKEKKEKKKKTKLPSFPGGMSSRFKAMRGRTGATETLPLSMFENTSPESDSDDDMRGRV